MKKLIFLLFVFGISVQVFAKISSKDVVGKWKYTVEMDMGEMSGTLKIVEKEGKLAGEVLPDEGGSYPFTKVELKEGNVLHFELEMDYNTIKVDVKIEGKKFKGTGTSGDGEFALTGEKIE